MDFVREAMFEAVVRQLFGADNVPKEKVGKGSQTIKPQLQRLGAAGVLIHFLQGANR